MNNTATVERMIRRHQQAALLVEYAERWAWLGREIRTRLNIVAVERIADDLNAGIQHAMLCYDAKRCDRARCGECGR